MRQICKKHVNHPNSKGPRCWRGFLKDETSLVVAAPSGLSLAAPLSGHGGLGGNTVFYFLLPLPAMVLPTLSIRQLTDLFQISCCGNLDSET